MEIKFVMERPSAALLGTAAYQIIERLVTVGDAAYVPPVVETLHGKIVAHVTGLQVKVNLEDGREIDAVIPKRLARNAFTVLPGDEADVVPKVPPKMARVVRLWRQGRVIEG